MNYFIIAYSLFLILTIVYRVRKIFAYKKKQERNKGVIYKKWMYKIQSILYIGLYFCYIIEFLFLRRKINLLVSVFGLSFYLLGIIIREAAIKALGRYWSVHIEIKEDHRLIKEGPYAYMRHPNLFSLLLEMNGLALVPNSYYSLLATWLIYFPLTLYRLYAEEKVLIEKFGQEYLSYKREVYSLLPIKKRRK